MWLARVRDTREILKRTTTLASRLLAFSEETGLTRKQPRLAKDVA